MNKNIILVLIALSIIFIGCGKKQVVLDTEGLEYEDSGLLKRGKIDFAKGISEGDLLSPLLAPEPDIRSKQFDIISDIETIYFEFDSSSLSTKARELLSNTALWLKKHKEYKILIEGHTDERGTTAYNLALGQERASKIRVYLTYLGIDPKTVATLSYGEEKPADLNSNEASWTLNRRADFLLFKD